MSDAGYSGTPLAKKLGIKEGSHVSLRNAPDSYTALVAPLPAGVRFDKAFDGRADIVHFFTSSRAELAQWLTAWRGMLKPGACIWVSWPKKASKVPTDVTEDVIREVALPLGYVDIKVCAVDMVWSGLKLVVRKAA
jgi:hypothetical protein